MGQFKEYRIFKIIDLYIIFITKSLLMMLYTRNNFLILELPETMASNVYLIQFSNNYDVNLNIHLLQALKINEYAM